MSNSISPTASSVQLAGSPTLRAPTETPKVANGHQEASPGLQTAPVAAAPPQDRKVQEDNLRKAVDQLNEQMSDSGRNLNFSIDKSVDRVVIKVRNSDTGEVIRQIPDEALLRVAHNLKDVRGMLLNEKT